MSVAQARSLLPKGTVIGVSCNTEAHVRLAVRDGADYVGIGAVWATQTKKLTEPVVGVRGVGAMLQVLDGTDIKAVAIGAPPSTYGASHLVLTRVVRRYQINQRLTNSAWLRVTHEPCSGWDRSCVRHRGISRSASCSSETTNNFSSIHKCFH
jgi:hypothetical protein